VVGVATAAILKMATEKQRKLLNDGQLVTYKVKMMNYFKEK
jgi:hypothetical protein